MSEDSRRSGVRRRANALLDCLGLLFSGQVLRTAWVSDDAFLTLRTIDNAVHGFGLRWNVVERVQTFTHPLWLFLVTPVYAATGSPYYSVLLASLLVSAATVAILAFRSGLPARHAALAVAVLVLSKAYVDYSTSGLENPLTHLLVLLLGLTLLRGGDWETTGPRIGLLAGLLGLNRLDLLAFAAPALGLAFARSRSGRTRWMVLGGLAPLALWHVFSLVYYGSLLPNSTLAKLHTGVPAGELFTQGVRYLGNSLAQDPVTLVVIVLALVAVAVDRRERPLALAAGVVLYLALVVKVGGDFMSGRFLTGSLIACVLLLASRPWPAARWFAPAVLAALAGIAALAPHPAFTVSLARELSRAAAIDSSGIADERRFYFSSTGLFNGAPGWERPTADARLRGLDLAGCGTPVAVESAVGMVGFFAGPKVHVIDAYGLGDPLLSRLPMVVADPLYVAFMRSVGAGVPRSPWRTGHFRRTVPAGYLLVQLTGENTIKDPDVARLWDRVRLVSRGDLLGRQRLLTVLRANLGLEKTGIPWVRQPLRSTDWSEVLDVRPDSAEAMYQIGRVQFARRQYAAAAKAFDAVLRGCPAHSQALRVSGDLRLQLREYVQAEALGRRAIAAFPAAQFGYLLTSVALAEQRRFEEATAMLVDLAERDRTAAATAWELQGELWTAAGDLERARSAFVRALDMDPELKGALESLEKLPK